MTQTPKTIAVTGGSGKLGRACISDLLAHSYTVVNLDANAPKVPLCHFTQTNFADFGATVDALAGSDDRYPKVDAVVHLAAYPAPGLVTNAALFENNTISTYNVFAAARILGIKNVVWASSETLLGIPFNDPPPYIPLDEEYAVRPESSYSLSKQLGETMAEQFCRWDAETKIIGLRFSNVMDPEDYAEFPGFDADARLRKWNLWGYIDARDGAQAVRRAVEYSGKGADVFIIANADTVMTRPNSELIAEVFPGVPMKREVEPNETLLSIDKARRVLGFEPEHSWRDEVK
ncbi:MAG: UDP-glucose 4-epimerase [uncultured Truepera sp.]|uniref:UDP-glucose 4-epimerase n=1 Tax=uncultured Truepera sp. TaxID=543023 RepID=A0A6J4VR53_9DEIN|nr:MAG: UDP-glucose 4-epimerase [uncultured Truepera sp.]